jgi:hypothetical protein
MRKKITVSGLLLIGIIGLLQPQLMLSQPRRANQSKAFKGIMLPYKGSWTGTLQYVGFQGQMLLYIDLSGRLYGSFESNDGSRFAQISGDHSGNLFHLIFTPPPGSSYMGEGSEPYNVNATAKLEGMNRFAISVPGQTGHPQSYTFERKVDSNN